jgi:hypothetical protein
LKKVAVEGGAAIKLCDAVTVRGASWGDDGSIVFAPLAGYSTCDLAPDGKRVAMLLPDTDDKQKPPTHLTFLFNFFDELERRK